MWVHKVVRVRKPGGDLHAGAERTSDPRRWVVAQARRATERYGPGGNSAAGTRPASTGGGQGAGKERHQWAPRCGGPDLVLHVQPARVQDPHQVPGGVGRPGRVRREEVRTAEPAGTAAGTCGALPKPRAEKRGLGISGASAVGDNRRDAPLNPRKGIPREHPGGAGP